jgi:hypothetical protein
MFQFCLNDCIPTAVNKHSLIECLERSLTEYKSLVASYPETVDGIVTSTVFHSYRLDDSGFSLADCIRSMQSRDLRTLAYRCFTKYPVEKYYAQINEDDVLGKEYSLTVNGVVFSAVNPVIVATNNGVLFTLGVHADLMRNTLSIASNTGGSVEVDNLFGRESNTSYIRDTIQQWVVEKLDNLEELLASVGANETSKRFISGYERAPLNIQRAIIEHFNAAIARQGHTRFFADGNLIKDVTPERNPHRVCELRIFNPAPFRVYFHEGPNKVYLALVEKKPAPKKQDDNINAAASIVNQLLLLD